MVAATGHGAKDKGIFRFVLNRPWLCLVHTLRPVIDRAHNWLLPTNFENALLMNDINPQMLHQFFRWHDVTHVECPEFAIAG